ncbi:unnamed protein product [Albugo candida]|uniref:Cyclin N-terminal domain-containing protein n=1 Tax=Albugo candida TaxID=65357 RepID=A0A024GCA6_9STRA|nr:unnamed protein product [Albugo candida]CCI45409.1 unnamed protein product [Albugo candida]|eukprot:CCI43952.1 unnamed protein product [Albugo candida]
MLADLTADNTASSSNERHFECFSNSLKKENIAIPKDEYYDAKHTQRDTESNAGRRLPGNHATWVKVPAQFRYRLATKYCVSSAIVRRWEDVQNQRGLLESRIFFSSGGGYPVAYDGNETAARRKRTQSVSNPEDRCYDWRGKAYFRLLHATWSKCDQDRDAQDTHPVGTCYIPNYLDDPEFRQGRHRHVVRGDKIIGPVISSILLFVKPDELKEELNRKFREKHTWLTTDLSLSKIRNLKRETLLICQRLDLEVATAALACVLFEKLILDHCVTKANRKLYMSVCLVLAAKFNEPQAGRKLKSIIRHLLIEIDRLHSIPSREVLMKEFTIYTQLAFNLHIPLCELQPHFSRLLKCMESNPRKYLDEDVFTLYSTLVLGEKAGNNVTPGRPHGKLDGLVDARDEKELTRSLKKRSWDTDEDTDLDVRDTLQSDCIKDGKIDRTLFFWRAFSVTNWWNDHRKTD